jgi:hypothetical protein
VNKDLQILKIFVDTRKHQKKVERRFGKKFAGFDDAITGRLRYSESRDLKTESIKKEGKSLPFLCFS